MASPEQQFALNILLQAGVDDLTEDIVKQLPVVSDIHAQYGTKPIVHNLESCERFRDLYLPEERFMAVAGMFNTGTNILGNLIVHNCAIPRPKGKKGSGMRQQVPWGKRKCFPSINTVIIDTYLKRCSHWWNDFVSHERQSSEHPSTETRVIGRWQRY